MESIALYEKLVAGIPDTVANTEPAYSLSKAITKTWRKNGSMFEENLLEQYELLLADEIYVLIKDSGLDEIEKLYATHASHPSFLRSLQLVEDQLLR